MKSSKTNRVIHFTDGKDVEKKKFTQQTLSTMQSVASSKNSMVIAPKNNLQFYTQNDEYMQYKDHHHDQQTSNKQNFFSAKLPAAAVEKKDHDKSITQTHPNGYQQTNSLQIFSKPKHLVLKTASEIVNMKNTSYQKRMLENENPPKYFMVNPINPNSQLGIRNIVPNVQYHQNSHNRSNNNSMNPIADRSKSLNSHTNGRFSMENVKNQTDHDKPLNGSNRQIVPYKPLVIEPQKEKKRPDANVVQNNSHPKNPIIITLLPTKPQEQNGNPTLSTNEKNEINSVYEKPSNPPQITTFRNASGKIVPNKGLPNIGNTCFINSLFQCFYHTPKFIQGCLEIAKKEPRKSVLLSHITCLFLELSSQSSSSYIAQTLKCITNLISHRSTSWKFGEMGDPNILFLDLIEWLSKDLQTKNLQEIPFLKIFDGLTKHSYFCRKCSLSDGKPTDSYNGELPILDISRSAYIQGNVENLFHNRTIESICPTCEKQKSHELIVQFVEVPQIFVINIQNEDSRTYYYNSNKSNNNRRIIEELVIPHQGGRLVYKFYAATLSATTGRNGVHSTAIIRQSLESEECFLYDDSNVSTVYLFSVNTYPKLVFYYLTKCIRL